MTRDENDAHEIIWDLALLLDVSIPLLEKEAEREDARESGKTLRNITARKRLEAARRAITRARKLLIEASS